MQKAKIGFITISDRASQGVYEDKGGPAMKSWITDVVVSPWDAVIRLIPDEQLRIEHTIIELSDAHGCDLVLTTGGTGPSLRDVTPEATAAVCDKVLDGFAEQMRTASLQFVPTAILSRQIAGVRGKTLIINLPGKPSAIGQCLEAVFAAVPYCIDLIGGARLETNPERIVAFRPKGA